MSEPVTPEVVTPPVTPETPPATPAAEPEFKMTPEIAKFIQEGIDKGSAAQRILMEQEYASKSKAFQESYLKEQSDLKAKAEKDSLVEEISNDKFLKERFEDWKINLEERSIEDIKMFKGIMQGEQKKNTPQPFGAPISSGGKVDLTAVAKDEMNKIARGK